MNNKYEKDCVFTMRMSSTVREELRAKAATMHLTLGVYINMILIDHLTKEDGDNDH